MNGRKKVLIVIYERIFINNIFQSIGVAFYYMDESVKVLAQQMVKKIDRKIRRELKANFVKMGRTIDIGADGTPTKVIDKIAEDAALKTLKKAHGLVNLLSEEAGFIDNAAEYTFILDPVDGTRNAYRGIPFFSVSLAVGRESLSDIEYGIVQNVATGDIYEAEAGMGAFCNKDHILVPDVSAREPLFSVNLGKRCDEKTINMVKKSVVRSLGAASLEMCLVGTGALDAYIVGRDYMRVTDIAASTLFLREAGGVVTDLYGDSLDMTLNLDERTSFLATGNMDLIKQLVKKRME